MNSLPDNLAAPPLRRQHTRILVVEDNDDHQELIRLGFEQRHGEFEVEFTRSVQEALGVMRQTVPDLVIADWRLPDGTGADLIQRKDGHIVYPVIVMTSNGSETLAVELMKSGIMDYIVKSAETFNDLPHIAARTIREWGTIRQREDADRELLRQREYYESILEKTHSGVWITNRDDVIEYANAGMSALAGIPRNTLVGKNFLTDFSRETTGELIPYYVQARESLRTVNYDAIRVVTPDGRETFQSGELVPRVINGEFQGIICTVLDVTDRKCSEQSLQHSRDFLQKIIDTANTIIIGLDLEGRITLYNKTAVAITGYTAEELAGRNWFEMIVPPERYPQVREEFRRLLTGGVPGEFENPILTKSGDERYILWRNSDLRDGERVTGTLSFGIDISGRKMAEEQVRKSRYLLEETMDLARMAMWEYDVRSDLFTFNDRFYALYGTTAEREGGYIVSSEYYAREFVYPDDSPLVFAEIRRTLGEHNPEYTPEIEHRIIRRDGEVRTIVVRYMAERDASGNVVKTYGANQDITEKKKAEDTLVRNRETLSSILNAITEPVFLMTTEGLVLESNETSAQKLGFARSSDIIGKNVYDSLPPDLIESRKKRIAEVLQTRQPVSFEDSRAGRHFSHTLFPVPGSDGTIARVAIFAMDITDRKQAEQMVARLNEGLLGLGTDAGANMEKLLALGGDMLGASFLLMNRIEGDMCITGASWNRPDDLPTEMPLSASLCYEVYRQDKPLVVIENLQEGMDTSRFPSIGRYGLCTYAGHTIRLHGEAYGTLCALFRENKTLTAADRHLLGLLATAIGREEERRIDQEMIRESEERFRQIFFTLPIGLWIADRDGTLIMGNPAGQEIWAAHPHVGQDEYGVFRAWRLPFREAIAPDDWALGHAVNEGRITERELLEIEAFDGSQKFILNWAVPLRNIQKEITGAFVLNQDITDMVQAERAIRESEERLTMALAASHAGTWDWDIHGMTMHWSPELYALLGLPENTHPSLETLQGVVHPEDRMRVSEGIASALDQHIPLNIEYRVVEPSTTTVRWLSALGSTLYDDNGRALRMNGLCIDSTEKKQTEIALEQARKKLGLLNTISFQNVRSNVFSALAYSNLAKNATDPETARNYRARQDDLVRSIGDSLDFMRNFQDLGMKPPLWQNLRDVIIYAISHLNFSSIEKVIGLTNLEIFADPLLEKAMVNIIQCAILGEGKTTFVEIHPAVHGGAVVVSITGNNQGFTTEERESLFQHSVGDQKGLGLFLAREILSITGITVTETGQPGSGTRFELLVPDGVWRYADKKDVGITPPSP